MLNNGTLVGAPIRRNDSLDVYPGVASNETQGGRFSLASSAERDALTLFERSWGMIVSVYPTDDDYKLVYNKVSTNLMDNGNWELVQYGGATATLQDLQSVTDEGAVTTNNVTVNNLIAQAITGSSINISANAAIGGSLEAQLLVQANTNLENPNRLTGYGATGILSEITLGANLTLSGGVLSASSNFTPQSLQGVTNVGALTTNAIIIDRTTDNVTGDIKALEVRTRSNATPQIGLGSYIGMVAVRSDGDTRDGARLITRVVEDPTGTADKHNFVVSVRNDDVYVEALTVNPAGTIRLSSLTGTGDRMVIASANGTLSTQAIPGAGVSDGVATGMTFDENSGNLVITRSAGLGSISDNLDGRYNLEISGGSNRIPFFDNSPDNLGDSFLQQDVVNSILYVDAAQIRFRQSLFNGVVISSFDSSGLNQQNSLSLSLSGLRVVAGGYSTLEPSQSDATAQYWRLGRARASGDLAANRVVRIAINNIEYDLLAVTV